MLTMNPAIDQPTVCRRFDVVGMTCGHCEHAIATEVGALRGVTSVTADAASGTLIVESVWELDVDDVAVAVDEAGYELAR